MSPGADFPPGVDPRTAPGASSADPPAEGPLRPAVAGASAASAPWLAGGGAVLLGLVVFLWLSSHRTHPPQEAPPPSQAADAAMVAAPPPPPEVDAMQTAARSGQPAQPQPAVALVTPPPLAPIAPPLVAPIAAAAPSPAAHAPVLVVDLAGATEAAIPTAKGAGANGGSAGASGANAKLNPDEQFAARVETGPEAEHARATMLENQSTLAPQGTIIPAVLETALNSDLPGFARAVVSRDVRSFDGSTVLIPRGSRVIGEYRSAVSLGQSRIFVIWSRVLRPDGGSIQIGSGGGDTLGRAGLAGKVDRHFFEQFGGAVLLTVLNAAAYAAASVAAGTPSTVVSVGSSGGGAGIGGGASGLTSTPIPPTIRVAQGTPIRIFVQRDLDFTPVGGTAASGAAP